MPGARKLEYAGPSRLAQEAAAALVQARGERSRRDLAQELGVSATTLRALETGEANPTLAYLETVAERYGIEVRLTWRRRRSA